MKVSQRPHWTQLLRASLPSLQVSNFDVIELDDEKRYGLYRADEYGVEAWDIDDLMWSPVDGSVNVGRYCPQMFSPVEASVVREQPFKGSRPLEVRREIVRRANKRRGSSREAQKKTKAVFRGGTPPVPYEVGSQRGVLWRADVDRAKREIEREHRARKRAEERERRERAAKSIAKRNARMARMKELGYEGLTYSEGVLWGTRDGELEVVDQSLFEGLL